MPESFAALVARLEEGHIACAERLKIAGRLVRYEPPSLVLSGSRPWSVEALRDLTDALKQATGTPWQVTLDDAPGQPSIREAEKATEEDARVAAWEDPLVQAARAAFPDMTRDDMEDFPGRRQM